MAFMTPRCVSSWVFWSSVRVEKSKVAWHGSGGGGDLISFCVW